MRALGSALRARSAVARAARCCGRCRCRWARQARRITDGGRRLPPSWDATSLSAADLERLASRSAVAGTTYGRHGWEGSCPP
eukprot:363414-Chlamydomonas_euryale.AAC.7